jgi:hypothetical protein
MFLQLFKLLPEWILDDLADFLLFGLQYLPAAVSASMDKNLLTWLLTILSHPQATSNTTVPGIKRTLSYKHLKTFYIHQTVFLYPSCRIFIIFFIKDNCFKMLFNFFLLS